MILVKDNMGTVHDIEQKVDNISPRVVLSAPVVHHTGTHVDVLVCRSTSLYLYPKAVGYESKSSK